MIDGKQVYEIVQPNSTSVLRTGEKAALQLSVSHLESDPTGVIDIKLRQTSDDLSSNARFWYVSINGGSRSLVQMALAGKTLEWNVHRELDNGTYQILVEVPGKTANAKRQKLTSQLFEVINVNEPVVVEELKSNSTTTTSTSKPTQTGDSSSSLPNESSPSATPANSPDDSKRVNPTIIGVAIACAVVGLSLVVLAIIILVRRARRKREEAEWREPFAELGGDAEFKRAAGELEAPDVKPTPEMDGREVVVYELDHTREERPVEMPANRYSMMKP